MKHFGISSLMAGCLLWALLDMVPIPTGNSCKDKKQQKQYEHYIRNRNTLALIPKPQIETLDVVDSGSTWAELGAQVTPNDESYMSIIKEYGISYKVNDDESPYINVPANNINKGRFSVKVNGLSPGVTYTYRPYVRFKASSSIEIQQAFGYNKNFVTK